MALDSFSDAISHNVHNWAWAFIRGLRDMGYNFTICCDTLAPVDLANVLLLLNAPTVQMWDSFDVCPRTCPSENAIFAQILGGLLGLRVCVHLVPF